MPRSGDTKGHAGQRLLRSCFLHPSKPKLDLCHALQSIVGAGSEVRTALAARCSVHEIVSKGDVVQGRSANSDFLRRLVLHFDVAVAETETHTFSLVEIWSPIGTGPGCIVCRCSAPQVALVHTQDIVCACLWRNDGDGRATVLSNLVGRTLLKKASRNHIPS